MNGEGRTLGSVAEIHAEIERLTRERDEYTHKLEDREQSKARETLREQVVGRYVMDCVRRGDAPANTWVSAVVQDVPDKAWLFRDDVMAADGYESKPDPEGRPVWSRC